jgi:hypothetical protein
MDTKRRLAAILFADIVDYTNQSHKDETKALTARKWVNNIIRERGLIRGGRVVKSLGDGSLLEFSSAVEAVSCAIEIQEQIQMGMGFDLPNEQVKVRIGIHVGDVVEEDGDVLGDAVNIASRVQGTALPGGICISREVYTHIRPILRLRCKRIPTSDKDRLPSSVEVLAIDEKEGATSVSLEAVKRNKARSKLPVVLAIASVFVLASIAFAMGWIQVPGMRATASDSNATPAASIPVVSSPGILQQTISEIEEIPFETKQVSDANLAEGESKILVQGVAGKREIIFEVVTKDGKEIAREKMTERITSQPTTQVVAISSIANPIVKVEATPVIGPVSTHSETKIVSIPYRSRRFNDSQLAVGKVRIRQDGQNGARSVVVQISTSGGRRVGRKVISDKVIKKPVDEIIHIGTRRTDSNEPSSPVAPVDKPSWFCPDCGVRWPGTKASCPNDGTKRPSG